VFRAHDGLTVGASVQFSNKSSIVSNKSNIEPHAVVVEVGPKKAPAGLPDGKAFEIFDCTNCQSIESIVPDPSMSYLKL
jgi:hypothetical protein